MCTVPCDASITSYHYSKLTLIPQPQQFIEASQVFVECRHPTSPHLCCAGKPEVSVNIANLYVHFNILPIKAFNNTV